MWRHEYEVEDLNGSEEEEKREQQTLSIGDEELEVFQDGVDVCRWQVRHNLWVKLEFFL